MLQINIKDAEKELRSLADAAVKGEDIFIVLENEQILQLIPVMTPKKRRKAGSAEGQIWMSDDFDAPLEDFDE
jgi:antitoxin (DNA-binding transcriptional repressor) of toxin-antitoxin stability system